VRSHSSSPAAQHSSCPQDSPVLTAPQDREPAKAEPRVCPALPSAPSPCCPPCQRILLTVKGGDGCFLSAGSFSRARMLSLDLRGKHRCQSWLLKASPTPTFPCEPECLGSTLPKTGTVTRPCSCLEPHNCSAVGTGESRTHIPPRGG